MSFVNTNIKKQQQNSRLKQPKHVIAKDDLMLVFSYVNANVSFTDECQMTDAEKDLAFSIVENMSESMTIDKSYVQMPGNMHEKVFIRKDGWQMMSDLIWKTKFGRNANKAQHEELMSIFETLIVCYLYQSLDDYGLDVSSIKIDLDSNAGFIIEYFADSISSWKHYRGTWQEQELKKSNSNKNRNMEGTESCM
jgi:hypothetical protein